MEKQSNEKRIYKCLIPILILAIVLIAIFAHLTAPKFTAYEEAIDEISIIDNNGVITLTVTDQYEFYKSNEGIYDIALYTTTLSNLFKSERSKDIIVNPDGEHVRAIYYVSNSKAADRVIYENNLLEDGTRITLARLFLNYYFVWASLSSLVLLALILLFRKREHVKDILMYILFIPLAYILSHLLVTGLDAATYAPMHDFTWMLALAIPIYVLCFILYKDQARKAQIAALGYENESS